MRCCVLRKQPGLGVEPPWKIQWKTLCTRYITSFWILVLAATSASDMVSAKSSQNHLPSFQSHCVFSRNVIRLGWRGHLPQVSTMRRCQDPPQASHPSGSLYYGRGNSAWHGNQARQCCTRQYIQEAGVGAVSRVSRKVFPHAFPTLCHWFFLTQFWHDCIYGMASNICFLTSNTW